MGLKFLVVGAGAVGGYFGGRLLEAGEDVTFLVRPKRRKQLLQTGLVLRSVKGDAYLNPPLIEKGETGTFDVVLLSTKAYQVTTVLQDIPSFIHEQTAVIPLLNGICHLDALDRFFHKEQVLGGLCFLESTLNEEGHILHTSSGHHLTFGARNGEVSELVNRIADSFKKTNADVQMSKDIIKDMWQKYLFISTLSGTTTLFNSPVGPIRSSAEGRAFTLQLIDEISTIIRHTERTVTSDISEKVWQQFVKLSEDTTASMQKDIERGLPIESDHIHGYLLQLAEKSEYSTPNLHAVYANLIIYEHRRNGDSR